MLRFVREEDCGRLLEIYDQYIRTPITFEYEIPTEAEFRERIRSIGRGYPYLVWEEDGRVLGYAYAHRQMERAAYGWNAELSVYLDRTAVSRGLGKRLARAVLDLLALQGVRMVYSLVTVPNEKSEGLHRALGFRQAGLLRRTGWKDGAWHDVAWFEKPIGGGEGAPAPVRSVHDLPAEAVRAVLEK
ncbi:GNAT family N-acetyltransferase [Pseudoflavonifractor sp. MSJ-37]|uniref:GNAT family N-acetyltransferase n=1 Tax=Pseudoflavonifractor sp. MSJ-37 TaxID=2841531 RepID=UPI001C0F7E8A|nr:GNAT family N-acetyltransferase [Pseudoflavonifractor sp. MSJ-37]MBU5434569.1 GNAT family N-acetyltransferase [Pseudoflavonifractor sp. MSJ-37]